MNIVAYTNEQKAELYSAAQANLTQTAVALKQFCEDTDEFVDDLPTAEQSEARRNYGELLQMIGRFSIEAQVNKAE